MIGGHLHDLLSFRHVQGDGSGSQAPDWPIPVKWPKRDPRCSQNQLDVPVDGELNTDLLLHYAVERISLPSGAVSL